jgi:hypothetical protein
VADAIRDGLLLMEQRSDGYRICRLNRQHGGVKDVMAGRPVQELPPFPAPMATPGNGAGGASGRPAEPVSPQEEWRRRARELGLPMIEEEEEEMYRVSGNGGESAGPTH